MVHKAYSEKYLPRHVQCAIVEFADSNLEMPGLPPRHFPLTPVPWKFTTTMTNLAGVKHNVHVARSQLNIQLAFAVTGHAAQGKTLPQVLVNLCEGRFAAYISASRVRTCEGLFVTETVSLKKLNRPVNSDLRQKCRRLERLEHNAKVCHGIEAGPILPVLDPESEMSISDAGTVAPSLSAETIPNERRSQQKIAMPTPLCFRSNPPECGPIDRLPTIPALRNPPLTSLSISPLFLQPMSTHYLPANPSSLRRNLIDFTIPLCYFVHLA